MKHYVLTMIGALAGAAAAFAGSPRIEWLHTTHDFGAFNESDGPATAIFLYTNTGDAPMVITGARANCGCTTPRYSADVLAPGDTASLVVSYDPAGRPGRFSKKVYVDTNTDPARSTLTIKGVVVGAPSSLSGRYPVEVGPMRMAHPAALLGSVDRGHVKSVFESAYNASADTLRPIVTDTPRWLDVSTVPAAVGPGEQVSFNFFVKSDAIPQWDIVTDTVTVRPFDGSPDFIRMPVVITVNEDFGNMTDAQLAKAPAVSVSATRLDAVQAGQPTSFTITNNGRSPLKIRRLYTATKGVTTDIKDGETIKPGKQRKVTVSTSAMAAGQNKASQASLILVTNDPSNPRTTIILPISR